jgi:hypothetical protein
MEQHHSPKKNWYEEAQRLIRKVADATKANMVMYGIGILFIIIIIFQAGMLVGARKDHYFQNNTARGDRYPIMERLPAAHGTTGIIISINFPSIVVADKDNTEKTLFVRDTTVIRGVSGDLTFSELKTGDLITVIGTPTPQGSLLANFIRVMPQ